VAADIAQANGIERRIRLFLPLRRRFLDQLIVSYATLQFKMLFYPVDISSGVSVSLRQWLTGIVM